MENTVHEMTDVEPGDTEYRIAVLENDVREMRSRNARVERNKSWETSRTRLAAVTLVTYVTMILVFVVLGSNKPILDAVVPTTGFFLSTLSLPFLRRAWEAKLDRDNKGRDTHSGPRG